MKTTLKELTKWAKAKGLIILKRQGEFKINFKGASEEMAFYTRDFEEAVEAAHAMVD